MKRFFSYFQTHTIYELAEITDFVEKTKNFQEILLFTR